MIKENKQTGATMTNYERIKQMSVDEMAEFFRNETNSFKNFIILC